MRDEVTSTKGMKGSRGGFAGGRSLLLTLTGVLAVVSAVIAWYAATDWAWWLVGGILAGLAVVSGVLAIMLLVQGGVSTLKVGDASMVFSALDVAADGRVITDAEGRVIYANAVYRALTGSRGSDPAPPLDLKMADDAMARRMKALLAAASSGGAGKEILAVILPDGSRHWLSVAAAGSGAGSDAVVWKFVDITSNALEREHVLATAAALGEALDAMETGLAVVDSGGGLALANNTLKSLPGEVRLPPAPTVGALVTVAGQKDKAPGLKIVSVEPLTRGLSLVLLKSIEGMPALHDVDQRFQRYFAEAPLAIATIDVHTRILDSNDLFSRLLPEHPRPDGSTLADIFPEADAHDVAQRVREAFDRGIVPPPVDVRLQRDPERRAQLFVHRAGGGGDILIVYLIDVTEQKNLELQFAQSQKMQAVGQLAGGIAHDFNNLLTAITGFCDLLLVRHGPGDQSFADIMQIKQNANRAANLTRQLLAFSRQQTLRPKVLIITDVLAELSNLLRRLIGENIELKMSHGRSLGPVRVDQGQLEQVIINLAVNARDAMPDGGSLTIRTANISMEESRKLGHTFMPPGEYVLIEVADTGVGIPKEHLGKIFEPFFSTKEVGKGTGLGLSTVYGIVKQTGGFVFPISEPGQGATFRIYLPVHKGDEESKAVVAAAAEPVAEKPKDLTGKAAVLLVEDEDAVRMFASRALKNKGYKVWEAASGEAALEIVSVHGEEIDLLISDVVMPNMDGPTLVKAMRARNIRMKTIFISGYAEDAFKKNLGKDEEFSFLPKPFSLKQLAEKVKEVLDA